MAGHNGGFNPYRDANGRFSAGGGSGSSDKKANRGPRSATYRANSSARSIPANARYTPPPKGRRQIADALSAIGGEDSSKRDDAYNALRKVAPGRAIAATKRLASLEASERAAIAKSLGMTVAQFRASQQRAPDNRSRAQVTRDVNANNTSTRHMEIVQSAKTSLRIAKERGTDTSAPAARLAQAQAAQARHEASVVAAKAKQAAYDAQLAIYLAKKKK